MKRCPTCGATFDVVAGFCPNDGAALLEVGAPVQRRAPDPGPRREVGGAAAGWQAAPASTARTAPSAHSSAAVPSVRYDDDGEEVLLGTVLAERYRIDRHIGAGGMGVVYGAVHIGIDKPLAIKVLRSEYAQSGDVAKRFELEARVATKINHPNVVDISDYGMTPGGSPYYVMELLEGQNLGDEIDENGAMDPERAVAIATALLSGLEAAHAHGIVHRDLKPDNIVLVKGPHGETPKILDFGIARVKTKRTRLTAAGSVVGTPEYMSPEQAQGKEVDARSDLYSLAAILFEMLTGEVPLRGATLVETLTKQVYDPAPRLTTVAPHLGEHSGLEELIARALSKDADERPASASQFAQALANALPKELGKASESSERLKATVAMGSWSVGDLPQPGRDGSPSGPSAHRGPKLNQGAPSPMGFSVTPAPAAAPAAPTSATPAAAGPQPAAAPPQPAAPQPTSAAPASHPAPNAAPRHGSAPPASHGTYAHYAHQRRASGGVGWPMILLIGGLGSVGVAFGVAAIFRILGSDPAAVAAEPGVESAVVAPAVPTGAAAGLAAAAPVPTASPEAALEPTPDPAPAEGDEVAADPEPEATNAEGGAPAAEPAEDPKPAQSTKKSTKTKKKTKKTSGTSTGTAKGDDAKTGGAKGDPPPEPKPEPKPDPKADDTSSKPKPKDPPADPGVTLGDLRDPFG